MTIVAMPTPEKKRKEHDLHLDIFVGLKSKFLCSSLLLSQRFSGLFAFLDGANEVLSLDFGDPITYITIVSS